MFIKFILSLLLCMSAVYSQYGWDNDDFRIPGSVLTGAAIIEQLADNEGLEIYGFADMSAVFIKLYIDGANLSTALAQNTWLINAPNNINIVSNSENVYVKLGDAAGVKAFIIEDSGGNDMAYIDSDGGGYFAGDVGIGVTDPDDLLHLYWASDASDKGIIIEAYVPSIKLLDLSTVEDDYQILVNENVFHIKHDANDDGTFESTRLSILADGNVGIGITEPLAKLAVKQSVNNYRGGLSIIKADDASFLSLFYDNSGSIWSIAASHESGGSYKPIGFFTSDVERMRIIQGGDVGIGTNDPRSKLDVNGSIDFNSVAAGARDAIEAVVVLSDMQGAVTDGQVPNDLTIISTAEIRTNTRFDVGGFNGVSSVGLIPVYNEGNPGDLSGINIAGGIIINYTTVP